jgi:hypothetical protein
LSQTDGLPLRIIHKHLGVGFSIGSVFGGLFLEWDLASNTASQQFNPQLPSATKRRLANESVF